MVFICQREREKGKSMSRKTTIYPALLNLSLTHTLYAAYSLHAEHTGKAGLLKNCQVKYQEVDRCDPMQEVMEHAQ